MKKVVLIIVLLIVVFAAVLIIKTFTYPFKKLPNTNETVSVNTTPSDRAIERFAGGIRIPTISNVVYDDTNFKPFDEFKLYLQKVYPRIYEKMDTVTVNKYGLIFHWKGKNSQAKPLLFLSHYDVVPVVGYDPETAPIDTTIIFQPNDKPIAAIDSVQTHWQYPPFSGAVTNGYIYGRGTLDMKGMLFSIMEAADNLIGEGFQPEQDIWIAFGQDEEVSGRQGAVKIAEYFKQQNLSFDAVYDEGGFILGPQAALESVDRPMALIGTGEKGFLTVRISVKGTGGHSSIPPLKGSLVYAAEIIEKLNKEQMPAQIIAPIQGFLDNIGDAMGFGSRLAIANQWALKSVLLNSLTSKPTSNALVRTTTAVTMAKGSDAPNVLSSVSEVTVNFRILPGNTIEEVTNHIKTICEGYDTELEVVSSREPSAVSPTDTKGYEIMQQSLSQIYPDAIVTPYITVGGTDAYKYQIVSDHIYRLMPVLINKYEQRLLHNENEQLSLENYGKMIWYFQYIMKNF